MCLNTYSIFLYFRFLSMSRGSLVPPLKRARTELIGSRPQSLPRFTDKEQASIDALYNNGKVLGFISKNHKMFIIWNSLKYLH